MKIRDLAELKRKNIILICGEYKYVKQVVSSLHLPLVIKPEPELHPTEFESEINLLFRYCYGDFALYSNNLEFIDMVLESNHKIDTVVTVKYVEETDTIISRILTKEETLKDRETFGFDVRF